MKNLKGQIRNQVRNQVTIRVGDQVSDQVNKDIWWWVMRQVCSQVRHTIENRLTFVT